MFYVAFYIVRDLIDGEDVLVSKSRAINEHRSFISG